MGGLKTRSAKFHDRLKIPSSAGMKAASISKKTKYSAPNFLDRIGLALLLAVLSAVAMVMWSKEWTSQVNENPAGKKD